MEDTICAVSTAPGAGGIAVIRISGPEAIAICNTIFVPRTAGKGLLSQKAYTLRYGSIRRGEELIDEVRHFPRTSFFYRRRHSRNYLPRFRLHPATNHATFD